MNQTSDQIASPHNRILSKKTRKYNYFQIIGIFEILAYNFKIGNGKVAQW